jgi:MerR family mercuric resistance operon transcriptional regulator
MTTLTSQTVAEAAGVNQQTVRYYERRGLIPPPPRTGSGYRMFPEDTPRRIRFIKQAQALGFTLREIKQLLDLRLRPGARCDDVRRRARAKVKEVRKKIETLGEIEAALVRLTDRCRGRGPVKACQIFDAMDGGAAAPRSRARTQREGSSS